MLENIVELLIEWYEENHRILPWRASKNPYYIWISEIMLQQTRVEAVRPFFERFIKALPQVEDVAVCPEEQLLKLWEGLGYYNRVRNIQKAAIRIVEEYGGRLPADYEKLKDLPGIGNYTAGTYHRSKLHQCLVKSTGSAARHNFQKLFLHLRLHGLF